jgi:excisionase family DNA binding protein
MTKAYLTPAEVAKLLRVAPVTVRMWAQKGMLRAETTPGGHRRYNKQEVHRFAMEYGISLQSPEEENELRILIVDDEPDWRELLSDILQDASDNLIIDVAVSGFETGQKVHVFKPHLILLDMMMPGISGLEICKALKESVETRSIRIIGITGFCSDETRKELIQAGAETCLAKPVDIDLLISAIGLPVAQKNPQH